MRGLTQFERAWLASTNPIVGDEGEAQLAEMRRVGRVSYERILDEAVEDGHYDIWPNSDLGNLALRVCPTEEA